MLRYLQIENFATIEMLELEFKPGLNIITGDTGSGKSIVINALSLGLGARADMTMIRHGNNSSKIQLIISKNDNEYIISREIQKNGKSICKINGELTTVSSLQEFTSTLIDIHGQYDNQALLYPENHLNFIDTYGREKLISLKESYLITFNEYKDKFNKLNKLKKEFKENQINMEYLDLKLTELKTLNLTKDEDIILKEELDKMANSKELFETIEIIEENINDEEQSKIDRASKYMEKFHDFDNDTDELNKQISDVSHELRDFIYTLKQKKTSLNFSKEEYYQKQERLNDIKRICAKYQSDLNTLIEEESELMNNLRNSSFENEIKRISKELKELQEEMIKRENKLQSERTIISKKLTAEISNQLNELNFNNSLLDFCFYEKKAYSKNGKHDGEFKISTNKGQELKSMSKILSGGEASRIMLAFKTILSNFEDIPVLIFDEIDTGISGKTASVVGGKIKSISEKRQVICITHLPQIAAFGDYNFLISKDEDNNNTYTKIRILDEKEKAHEIANLMSGSTITDETLLSAEKLIESTKV